jgi:single-stranded-DNA-specific exonuclease
MPTRPGNGKGSGRSIAGVDLGAAIIAAREAGLLVAGGGHAMAAGLTIDPTSWKRWATGSTSAWAAMSRRQAMASQALLLDLALAPGGLTPSW